MTDVMRVAVITISIMVIVMSLTVAWRYWKKEWPAGHAPRYHVALVAMGVCLLVGSDLWEHIDRLRSSEAPNGDLYVHFVANLILLVAIWRLFRPHRVARAQQDAADKAEADSAS